MSLFFEMEGSILDLTNLFIIFRSSEDYYKILDQSELFLSCFEDSASRTMSSPFPKSPPAEDKEGCF